ncbi:ABC transporter ATP-binding protein [Paenibacillus antibioticophila]|uniref:ABC transporter ATP-binding protein n=1 Tax=Paenibacillus antibioticophila TaxID=1274374 RepID=A0A920CJ91_9BACL|nr:dipeptide ABC transporter ATP-binding protein [Paenibacillus antibioticophila]GIO38652.1 ABC transporter ATP-binding protein [Paenibacillus antibioticophila]
MNHHHSSEPLLQVENLKKYYPIHSGLFVRNKEMVKAVDGISFSLHEGETLGIIGESGSGKSTMGRLVLQLEKPTDGSVIFQGQEITGMNQKQLRPLRSQMQIIFQDPYSSLNPRKRIGNQLAEAIRVHRLLEGAAVDRRVEELLNIVGLSSHYRFRYPHEFSGGQRQRIGIARALALNPKLIICDEPVSALDVSIQAQILNLLKDLQQELGLTYLFIAHGLGAIDYISDQIGVVYLGKLVELGRNKELFDNPRHPYTAALLASNPPATPHERRKERYVIEGDIPNMLHPPSGCRFHTRCPYAQTRCREEEPLLQGEGGRLAACHFPLD